jgi:hypothetical protein
MATPPLFLFPNDFLFSGGVLARAGAIRGRMRTRGASPISSVNPRHENVRIASDEFGARPTRRTLALKFKIKEK